MIQLADRLNRIQPSPTLAMTAKAAQLKAEGKNIINLSAGEPDFDTPDFIKKAAIEALTRGETKYTAVDGTPLLKKAIADKFYRDNNLSYSLDQITVSNGGKQVIFNALLATINPEDEVIIPAPYWVSYPDIVNLFGGKSVIVPCSGEQDFKMTAAQLESAITNKTKWVILNSPSNPTGSLYTEADLRDLAAVLRRFPHVYILSDDIYEYLVYDGAKFSNIAMIAPDLIERTLIVNGVSKSYSMTGWRIGYGVGPRELVRAMSMLQSQSTSNACSISQAAAAEALNGTQDFLEGWRESFTRRRNLVIDELSQVPGLVCREPEGAFYVYIGCEGVIGKKTPEGVELKSDNDFSLYLLDAAGVATVSGDAFGLSPYFRISYATSDDLLKDACLRIRKAVEALS